MLLIYRNKDRGASVEVLRGNSGADFEGEATVVRCAGVNTSCFSCSGDKVSKVSYPDKT